MEYLEELTKILQNLKKTPYRTYTENYIEEKTIRLTYLKKQFEKENIDKDLHIQFKDAFSKIEDIIGYSKMASFDLLQATKIIPEFSGKQEDLQNFLNLIELYKDTLKQDHERNLINFVMRTRLSEKLQNKLAVSNIPQTFANFKTIIKENYEIKRNASHIHAKLNNLKQNGTNISHYIENIENLIAELNKIQIDEMGEGSRPTIVRLNENIALNTFKQGLNDKYKTIIYAANPKTFNEARNIALELYPDTEQNRVMHFNHNYVRNTNRNGNSQRSNYNNQGNRNTNYNNHYSRSNHSNIQNRTFNNSNNNYNNTRNRVYHNNNNHYNNNNNQRNNNNNSNYRYNNSNNRNQNYNNNQRIFNLESGNSDSVSNDSTQLRDVIIN